MKFDTEPTLPTSP